MLAFFKDFLSFDVLSKFLGGHHGLSNFPADAFGNVLSDQTPMLIDPATGLVNVQKGSVDERVLSNLQLRIENTLLKLPNEVNQSVFLDETCLGLTLGTLNVILERLVLFEHGFDYFLIDSCTKLALTGL
jgi:hypothetical protein